MVALGGAWFFPEGACMVFPRGLDRFFPRGGMRGFFPGVRGFSPGGVWVCMVFSGGVHRIRRDTVNEWAVRILLECILVRTAFVSSLSILVNTGYLIF